VSGCPTLEWKMAKKCLTLLEVGYIAGKLSHFGRFSAYLCRVLNGKKKGRKLDRLGLKRERIGEPKRRLVGDGAVEGREVRWWGEWKVRHFWGGRGESV